TSASDQLLSLNEKFDLSNTAATKLHIVTANGNIAIASMGMNLPLDRMHIGNGCIVEIFSPDIRRKFRKYIFARLDITCYGAGLDHRGALPILPPSLIITNCRTNGDRQGCGAGIGTQSQIYPKNITVGGAILQNPHQPACHTRKGFDTFI